MSRILLKMQRAIFISSNYFLFQIIDSRHRKLIDSKCIWLLIAIVCFCWWRNQTSTQSTSYSCMNKNRKYTLHSYAIQTFYCKLDIVGSSTEKTVVADLQIANKVCSSEIFRELHNHSHRFGTGIDSLSCISFQHRV